ncbi:helix-turn-helix domain-containing protein [Brachybacterium sp. MASK1Z-5]|uniref:Helix-turn-helix domain-containing protein n=1 Tax=Brachybacterium halotolerans TaxID=2795215 RepID=A0ABS1B8E2_9MICO|nr:PucR family transcriptional regulator [Brachybacterium halotolerans]MBK0330913.1 helix-turn-helix domain-containing protein [Brachybacterium halotolerans]
MIAPPRPVLDGVLNALARAHEELVDLTCTRIHDELASYAYVDASALAEAVGRNLRTALTALRTSRVPDPEELSDAAQTARERFLADIPVEEIVRGFRISIALIHERFVDLAISQQLSAAQSVAGVRVMWGVADAFTTRIITEYHDLEVDSALHDAQRRMAVVRDLLAGVPRRGMLEPRTEYAAIRCAVPEGAPAEQMRRHLQRSGSLPEARAHVVTDGSSCFGIVAGRPADPGAPVGLGPFGPPDQLPVSDRTAKDALHLAHDLGRDGVQSIEDLGWRLALAARPDVRRHYAQRLLDPIVDQGRFGAEVLAAVDAWIRSGQSIPRTAERLVVHPNTVRYRLRRFEALTGADLADPDDVTGARCAIELGSPDVPSL